MGRGEKRSETRRNRRLNIKDGQMWALVAFTALSKLQWGWNVNNDINEKYAKGTGSPVFCEKEGVEVEVPWISSDPCISCKCQANIFHIKALSSKPWKFPHPLIP
ncbi:uncharacterized protein TNCT_686131 [Trichonephila clavata]|uniref:Uncharacterized protein n=1 Tax=Trichonephila clavata TaxID=2740835 RepID=A0A8X6KY51_TRICU|nr:uncharacterized protein TNCT_686131 [Trichonephila clavata]